MKKTVAIGIQDFNRLIQNGYFYIDKTDFIREWWDRGDSVTLITRPRRFGKTLNLNMLDRFFSIHYAGQSSVFEGLSIWETEPYRALQGTYPVISLSFAAVKEKKYADARKKICQLITNLYTDYSCLFGHTDFTEKELGFIQRVSSSMDDADASLSLHQLSKMLSRCYGKKVIILLDKYDAALEAKGVPTHQIRHYGFAFRGKEVLIGE